MLRVAPIRGPQPFLSSISCKMCSYKTSAHPFSASPVDSAVAICPCICTFCSHFNSRSFNTYLLLFANFFPLCSYKKGGRGLLPHFRLRRHHCRRASSRSPQVFTLSRLSCPHSQLTTFRSSSSSRPPQNPVLRNPIRLTPLECMFMSCTGGGGSGHSPLATRRLPLYNVASRGAGVTVGPLSRRMDTLPRGPISPCPRTPH